MKVTITLTTGNDAVQGSADLAKVLRVLARRIEDNGVERVTKVLDINGNTVGTVDVEK